jgi:hypothetical protein
MRDDFLKFVRENIQYSMLQEMAMERSDFINKINNHLRVIAEHVLYIKKQDNPSIFS